MKDKNRLDLDVQEKWLDETYPNLPYVPDPDLVQLAYVLIARAQELEARVAELEAEFSTVVTFLDKASMGTTVALWTWFHDAIRGA